VRESLLAGVPAVVSELGGMSELVGPSSGRVAAHDDEASWRAALGAELRLRRAGSHALLGEVLGRAVSDEAHLSDLVHAYRVRTAERLFQ
jgi:hypothetical protein